LHDAAYSEQTIPTRFLHPGFKRLTGLQQAFHQSEIDLDRRRSSWVARDVKRRLYRAALKLGIRGGARLRLERVEAWRQAELQIKPAAIDAAQLPDPTLASMLALSARESGHARNGHGPLSRICAASVTRALRESPTSGSVSARGGSHARAYTGRQPAPHCAHCPRA
jgi:hypothetical protein